MEPNTHAVLFGKWLCGCGYSPSQEEDNIWIHVHYDVKETTEDLYQLFLKLILSI